MCSDSLVPYLRSIHACTPAPHYLVDCKNYKCIYILNMYVQSPYTLALHTKQWGLIHNGHTEKKSQYYSNTPNWVFVTHGHLFQIPVFTHNPALELKSEVLLENQMCH